MRADIRSAQKALKQLSSREGHLGAIEFHGHVHKVTALPPVITKPYSRVGLKWTWDSGHARRIEVEDLDRGKKRILYVYYGPWSRKQVHSAYLVVFHGGGPILEVRLSKRAPPRGEKAFITHAMRFSAGRFRNKPKMHETALRLARKAEVEVRDDKAVIGAYRLADGHLQPGPKRILLNAIACALAAIDVRVTSKVPGQKSGTKRPKKKKFTWKAGQKIEILLDAKFGSQELHEKLIDEIEADLKALGVTAAREHPYDLVVRKGQFQIIVEAKAWPKGGVLAAAIAATGQLLHYRDLFGGAPRLLLALWKAPHLKELRFLTSAQIGLLWRSKGKWSGDGLTRKLLPELLG